MRCVAFHIVMQSVVMLSVVMLSVVMLNVVATPAPLWHSSIRGLPVQGFWENFEFWPRDAVSLKIRYKNPQ